MASRPTSAFASASGTARHGTPPKAAMMLPMRVWDAPTRLFHWVLVVLIAVSWASIEFDYLDLHIICGQAILALLIFRIVWGIIGSDTARFGKFLVSPLRGLQHLRHIGGREPDTQVGHNEAGGWMVLAMLAVVLAQAVSGLFVNNPRAMAEGPLAHLISERTGLLIRRLHDWNFTLIQILVIVHVLAVGIYAVVKRHDLVRPMITGKKRLPATTPQPRMRSPLLAAAILVVAVALVWAVIALA